MSLSTALNLLSTLLALVGTLAAFGGELCPHGPEPLRLRITRRGWVSLGALLLGFFVLVAKEILASHESLAVAAEKLDAQTKLSEANSEIKDANKQISFIERELIAARQEARDARTEAEQREKRALLLSIMNSAPVGSIDIVLPSFSELESLHGRPLLQERMREKGKLGLSAMDVFLLSIPRDLRSLVQLDIGLYPTSTVYEYKIRENGVTLLKNEGSRFRVHQPGSFQKACIILRTQPAKAATTDCENPKIAFFTDNVGTPFNAAKAYADLHNNLGIARVRLNLERPGFVSSENADQYRRSRNIWRESTTHKNADGSFSVRLDWTPDKLQSVEQAVRQTLNASRLSIATQGGGVVFSSGVSMGNVMHAEHGTPNFLVYPAAKMELTLPQWPR